MPALTDFKSPEELEAHFATRSYADGFLPSQADVALLDRVKTVSESLHHLKRWKTHITSFSKEERARWPKAGAVSEQNGTVEDDDDVDLFGSSDDEEASAERERVKQQRLADYAAKKAKKPGPIAKSNIILDVKPYDDETDMKELENRIRQTIQSDGLVWGPAKLVPVAYGIKKLQIGCVVEDEKIGTDFLEDSIMQFDDVVQSVDIAAFNKV